MRMKITEVRTHPVSIRLEEASWTAHEALDSASNILVEVRTEHGIGATARVVCATPA